MKKTMFYSSIIVIVFLIYGAVNEYLTTDWRDYQAQYAEFVEEDGFDFNVDYRQLVLPHFNKIDRCVICHVGISDPNTKDLDNPLSVHPGSYLDTHDPNKFGCTICHDGQGRATTKESAFACESEEYFWEEPVLVSPYLEANCARCHRSEMPVVSGTYQRGERLFIENGCQSCHTVQGRGGSLGPELTTIGQASFHAKRPHHDNEHLIEEFNGNVNLAYIFEAVYQPKIQPDSSQMIDYGFTKEEAIDLTVYIKSLQEYAVPEGMIAASGVVEESGEDLYARYCSACHGKNGKGTNLAELGKLGPALGNPQFLAIVDHDFLSAIIDGSGSSVMPAWGSGGGLAKNDISKIADHVLQLRKEAPLYKEIQLVGGEAKYGRTIFNANCAGCHGIDGEYETDLIGPTLRSPQLLSLFDNEKYYETIVNGRAGTAMPGWNFLSKQDLADVMAYVESWRDKQISYNSFASAIQYGSTKRGSRLFYDNCAACHGDNKEGGVGPSLNSKELHTLADNKFMYNTIVKGRRNTAMSSYNHLGKKALGDIMAYLRSGFKGTTTGTSKKKIVGSEFNGKYLFERTCAQCHGQEGVGLNGPAIGNKDFLTNASDEYIWKMAAYGRTGTQMKGNLHGQNGTSDLSKSELNDIVSYVRTLEKNPPQLNGISTIPGDVANGRDAFNDMCSQCHGAGGGGGNGPGIGKEGFLESVSDGFIVAMMMSGRDGTEMKKFGRGGIVELDENTAMNIVYYLRHKDKSEIGEKYLVGTPQNGKILYEGQCIQCHQKGSFAPDLMRSAFVKAAPVGYLQATMSLGRHQTAMQSMIRGNAGLTELSSKEINDIISYIKMGKE